MRFVINLIKIRYDLFTLLFCDSDRFKSLQTFKFMMYLYYIQIPPAKNITASKKLNYLEVFWESSLVLLTDNFASKLYYLCMNDTARQVFFMPLFNIIRASITRQALINLPDEVACIISEPKVIGMLLFNGFTIEEIYYMKIYFSHIHNYMTISSGLDVVKLITKISDLIENQSHIHLPPE